MGSITCLVCRYEHCYVFCEYQQGGGGRNSYMPPTHHAHLDRHHHQPHRVPPRQLLQPQNQSVPSHGTIHQIKSLIHWLSSSSISWSSPPFSSLSSSVPSSPAISNAYQQQTRSPTPSPCVWARTNVGSISFIQLQVRTKHSIHIKQQDNNSHVWTEEK